MKSQKDFRTNQTQTADTLRKAVKLEPIRKSGKEKHEIYKGLSHSDEDEEDDYSQLKKRESILDYMSDDEDDEEGYDEEDEDDFEEEEDDFEDEEDFEYQKK